MIKIIFKSGEIMKCDHIDKIYIEEIDWEKTVLVGSIEDCKDLRKMSFDEYRDYKEGLAIIKKLRDEAVNEVMHVDEPGNCHTCAFLDLCNGQPEEVGIECQR